MSFSYKFFLRPEKLRKDGTCTIYLRIIVDRRKKEYALEVSVPIDLWDATNQKIKKSLKYKSEELNAVLSKARMKIETIQFESKLNSKKLSIEEVEKKFIDEPVDYSSFYDYCSNFIKERKHKFSSESFRTYESQVTKMKLFKSDLKFHEVNVDFLKKYETYMIADLKNKTNTVYKSLGFIKTVWNESLKEGIVSDNIFKYFPLKKKDGNRNFLSIEELKKLENILEDSNLKEYQINVLKYFLFSCYTGLRYTDIKNLRHFHLVEGNILKIEMHKTKEIIRIPLIAKAKKLIEPGFENQTVFKVASNQKANKYIKEIISIANIHKDISFHCARHTFATCSIELGMPIEVISKLLGHHDLKTTQIYAKIIDSVKIKEMEKWEF